MSLGWVNTNRYDVRTDAISTFTGVSTFFAGFAIADLSSFKYADWTEPSATIYAVLMSIAVGNMAYCSVLGILITVTYYRLKSWDKKYGKMTRAELNVGARLNHGQSEGFPSSRSVRSLQ